MFKKIFVAITVFVILVSLILFYLYKDNFFVYTAANFGICPEDSILIDMSSLEELVSIKEYPDILPNSHTAGMLIGYKHAVQPYLLMKCKVKYMKVKTIEDLQGGVLNYCELLLSFKDKAPKGFLFKYSLKKMLEIRKYSKVVRIQFNEYVPQFDKKLVKFNKENGTLIKF